MKKVKILRNTVAGGKRVKIGDVVEVSDADAFFLVNRKRAERCDETVKQAVKKKTYTRKADGAD